jgi:hypothetical protein
MAAPQVRSVRTLPAPRLNSHSSLRNAGAARYRPVREADPLVAAAPVRQSRAAVANQTAASVGGTWTSLGPQPVTTETNLCTFPPNYAVCASYGNASGRITSLVANPTNSAIVYAGAAGGGVWKSSDSGNSWAPLTDNQPTLAIGSLAIDSTGQIIFAGTGEANASTDSQGGQGILKSTDGGTTWTLLGQATFAGAHIGGIAIDRSVANASHVFAATDLGLFVSNDGGTSWTSMASSYLSQLSTFQGRPPPTGAAQDIIQAPYDPKVYWLTVSDFCNTEGGDILVSSDSGATFKNANPTFLTAGSSRISIGAGQLAVYAAVADCNENLNQIDKLTNPGGWSLIPQSAPGYTNYFNAGAGGQGGYDNVVAVDPTNSNQAVFGGVTLLATRDGGASFSEIAKPYTHGFVHPDFHAVAFTGPSTFYVGNDGGVYRTTNLGGTARATDWTNLSSNLNTIQFHSGSAFDTTHLIGGAQDNGTIANFSGALSPGWPAYLDGDGTATAIDPTPGSHTIYASYSQLGIERGNSATPYNSFVEAMPCRLSSNNTDPGCTDPTTFRAPFAMDPSNPQRIVGVTNRVWYSATGGVPAGPSGWNVISADLTTGTRFNAKGDALGALAMGSAGVTGPIVVASRYGMLSHSNNSGTVPVVADWVQVTGNLPPFPGFNAPRGGPTFLAGPAGWISAVAVNPTNPKEAWVTIGGLNVGHVWHTMDISQGPATSWADISGAGFPNVVADTITLDPATGIVYVGTDTGVVACSSCGGASATGSWSPLGTGLPNVMVSTLSLTHDGTALVAWTYGRGAWSISTLNSPIVVTPTSLSFAVSGTTPPPAQPFTIANQGTSPINWTATVATSSGTGWLSASPTAGSTAVGASSPVSVTVNPTGLGGGVYTGTITVNGNTGSATVAVTLSVPVFPGQYQPLPPNRILDTRSGVGGFSAPVRQAQVISVQVAGAGGVPKMTDANPPSAVVLNVTAVNATLPSYLTVYPDGVTRPLASNLNFVAGQAVPNLVEVALGSNGKVSVYNNSGTVDVIFDVAGWVSTQGKAPAPATAGLYRPLVPARLLDTRTSFGGSPTMNAGQTINLQVTGKGNVPATGVSAAVLNVTVTGPTAAGYLTVFPSGAPQPVASNVNFVAGQTVPNRVIVKVGTGGQVSIFNFAGRTDVVVDVGGWFTDGSDPAATGGQSTGLTPARILDTRIGQGAALAPVCANGSIAVQVAGQGLVPAMTDPVKPTAAVLNVTVTDTTGSSFLTVYPSDAASRPLASDLNWPPGKTVPNLVVVKLGADGKVAMYNLGGCTNVIADVVGWYN